MKEPIEVDEHMLGYIVMVPIEGTEYAEWIEMDDQYQEVTLYVPAGTKERYANTAGWRKFQNIVDMATTTILNEAIADSLSSVSVIYSLEGCAVMRGQITLERLKSLPPGCYIVGGKKYFVK